MIDVVARFIELKEQNKSNTEELSALELLIFESHRDDTRIKIFPGNRSITIKPETYEILTSVDVDVEVTEKRFKVLKEFDIDVQEMILANPENYNEKFSKESIRVVKSGE